MAERQKIIETNRSIRSIKNELESLLEKDILSYDAYTQIHSLLPAESSLNGAGTNTPTVIAAKTATATPTPTAAFNNLSLSNTTSAAAAAVPPPSYAQTTTTAPPALPTRNNPNPPTKPVLTHARALYRYAATDARDVSFEKDDRIAVHEYMNADWWMGRNERTGAEGIFPRTYVEVVVSEKSEKMPYAPPVQQPQYSGYPPAPVQANPYNASAPPMAVANEQQQAGGEAGGGKGKEMGKKFGKKLGNAAIFGAGATIGSNIVNSIF